MNWSLPPQSCCGHYKLLATDKKGDEIYLVLIGDGIGAIKQRLDDLQSHHCEKLQAYISTLLPEILRGVYDTDLMILD